uniref:Uncharacterized protein n=1 Tax=Oryza glumipatula TaxID=40148 RepID=A0A0D9ZNZ6_9ORYZ
MEPMRDQPCGDQRVRAAELATMLMCARSTQAAAASSQANSRQPAQDELAARPGPGISTWISVAQKQMVRHSTRQTRAPNRFGFEEEPVPSEIPDQPSISEFQWFRFYVSFDNVRI